MLCLLLRLLLGIDPGGATIRTCIGEEVVRHPISWAGVCVKGEGAGVACAVSMERSTEQSVQVLALLRCEGMPTPVDGSQLTLLGTADVEGASDRCFSGQAEAAVYPPVVPLAAEG